MRTNAYSDDTETRNIIEKRDFNEGDIIEKVKKTMTFAGQPLNCSTSPAAVLERPL